MTTYLFEAHKTFSTVLNLSQNNVVKASLLETYLVLNGTHTNYWNDPPASGMHSVPWRHTKETMSENIVNHVWCSTSLQCSSDQQGSTPKNGELEVKSVRDPSC